MLCAHSQQQLRQNKIITIEFKISLDVSDKSCAMYQKIVVIIMACEEELKKRFSDIQLSPCWLRLQYVFTRT